MGRCALQAVALQEERKGGVVECLREGHGVPGRAQEDRDAARQDDLQ